MPFGSGRASRAPRLPPSFTLFWRDFIALRSLQPENSFPSYLTIKSNQEIFLDFAGFGIDYEITGPPDGPPISTRVNNNFFGTAQGKLGALDAQSVCFKDASGSLDILTKVFLGPSKVESMGKYYFKDSVLTYSCSGNTLKLIGKGGKVDYTAIL